ncbi:MAG: response regulator receiver and antar domain protein [Nocardioides sp.]|jgi:transcriptional regulator with GAF, ATPase, and Fis domain|nr:response regulator receiver and antar domain protein [Nocardioides sp.]
MEPIPETREAIDEFGPFIDDDLLAAKLDAADRIRDVVPSCVGLSLGLTKEGLTFTVQATADEIARLDAVQYLDGGPCVEIVEVDTTPGLEGDQDADGPRDTTALDHRRATPFRNDDPLVEQRWQSFAAAAADAGIASTLTLPILDGRTVVGSVNLYAVDVDAFDGHHEHVADICRAWAPGAVTNADLSFETRQTARRAPQVLREQISVDRATGVLSAQRGISLDEARAAIRDVAQRAGVEESEVAELVLQTMRPEDR